MKEIWVSRSKDNKWSLAVEEDNFFIEATPNFRNGEWLPKMRIDLSQFPIPENFDDPVPEEEAEAVKAHIRKEYPDVGKILWFA